MKQENNKTESTLESRYRSCISVILRVNIDDAKADDDDHESRLFLMYQALKH